MLVVEDKESLRSMLRKTLEARGLTVEEAGDAYEARRRLQTSRVLVVLTDLKLPAGSGLDVLEAAKEADPDVPVIVMTAFATVDDAVKAMKQGATDYVLKNRLTRLAPAVSRALSENEEKHERRRAEEKLRRSHEQLRALSGRLGSHGRWFGRCVCRHWLVWRFCRHGRRFGRRLGRSRFQGRCRMAGRLVRSPGNRR